MGEFNGGESYQGSGEGIKSLYEAPIELHEIRVLIDGEEFAKFSVDKFEGGKFTTILENYLDDSDWHKW